MATTVKQRITLEGGDEIKAKLVEVGDAGEPDLVGPGKSRRPSLGRWYGSIR
ncbi:MAG TPA: hypothetical protein VM755_19780 [Stellaceae bacterium]|nr:hypothetical protein [Stellaceae bacterium]